MLSPPQLWLQISALVTVFLMWLSPHHLQSLFIWRGSGLCKLQPLFFSCSSRIYQIKSVFLAWLSSLSTIVTVFRCQLQLHCYCNDLSIFSQNSKHLTQLSSRAVFMTCRALHNIVLTVELIRAKQEIEQRMNSTHSCILLVGYYYKQELLQIFKNIEIRYKLSFKIIYF